MIDGNNPSREPWLLFFPAVLRRSCKLYTWGTRRTRMASQEAGGPEGGREQPPGPLIPTINTEMAQSSTNRGMTCQRCVYFQEHTCKNLKNIFCDELFMENFTWMPSSQLHANYFTRNGPATKLSTAELTEAPARLLRRLHGAPRYRPVTPPGPVCLWGPRTVVGCAEEARISDMIGWGRHPEGMHEAYHLPDEENHVRRRRQQKTVNTDAQTNKPLEETNPTPTEECSRQSLFFSQNGTAFRVSRLNHNIHSNVHINVVQNAKPTETKTTVIRRRLGGIIQRGTLPDAKLNQARGQRVRGLQTSEPQIKIL